MKEEIKKEYAELIVNIENMRMYDGRNKGVDVYMCETCKGITLTRYRDKGVTPFVINCEYCKHGAMKHVQTITEELASVKCQRMGIKVKDWIRPTEEQLLNLTEGMQDHVLNGGLLLEEDIK